MAEAASLKYPFPPMPDKAVTLKARAQKKGKTDDKTPIIAGSIGIMAGVAGAVGLAAYLRAPEMDEQTVTENIEELAVAEPTPVAEDPVAPISPVEAPVMEPEVATPKMSLTASPDVQANIPSRHENIEPVSDLDAVEIAFGVNDSMSFNQAFAAARAEVGPGGIFSWHGGLYNTYYSDEWRALSPAYRAEFSSHDYSDRFDTVEVAVPVQPGIHQGLDGQSYITLTDAITGEPVEVLIDDNSTIIVDIYGNYYGSVPNDQIITDGGAIFVEPNGNVVNLTSNDVEEVNQFVNSYISNQGGLIEIGEGDEVPGDVAFTGDWNDVDEVYQIADDEVSLIELDDASGTEILEVEEIQPDYIDEEVETAPSEDLPVDDYVDDDTIEPIGSLPFDDYSI